MPSTRPQRHQRIATLIAQQRVRTQQHLQELLEGEGILTTQATLSRDLRELGVAKTPGGYLLPGETPASAPPAEVLGRALQREMLSVECAATLVVLRTRPGHANALAIEIDRAKVDGAIGTIAGDDTIFVATASARYARTFADRCRTLAGHQ